MLTLACGMAVSAADADVVRADPPAASSRTSATSPTQPPRAPTAVRAEPLPQACEQDAFHVDYGALREGSLVRLGRHRSVDGNANWDPSMEHFVGRVTPVTSARGLDPQGCAIIEVAVDGGEYVWRVRDVSVVAAAPDDEPSHVPELRLAPGFVPDPQVYESRIGTLTRRANTLESGCTGWVGAHPTFTMLLEDDFPTFSVMAHSSVDTVLLVRTPAGEFVCVDDVDGRDPILTGRAGAGRYEVYVGAFEAVSGEPRFRLALSERGTVRASSLEAVAEVDVRPLEVQGDGRVVRTTHLQPGRPVRPASTPSSSPRPPAAEGDPRPSSNTR
jgi:hypothetical protein